MGVLTDIVVVLAGERHTTTIVFPDFFKCLTKQRDYLVKVAVLEQGISLLFSVLQLLQHLFFNIL